MLTRLHSKYPKLAQMILASPPAKVKQIVATAAKLALQNTGLEGDLLRLTLAAVEGKETLQPDTKAKLTALQEKLDDSYLDAQDLPDDHTELPAEALQSFCRARALAAVLDALAEVDAAGATDIVYEAIASYSDDAEIIKMLLKASGNQ